MKIHEQLHDEYEKIKMTTEKIFEELCVKFTDSIKSCIVMKSSGTTPNIVTSENFWR